MIYFQKPSRSRCEPQKWSRSSFTKKPMEYLPPLRLFETILVTRYFSTREKLQVFSLLNKAWHYFIFQNFIWTQFPKSLATKALHSYKEFLFNFDTLQGIYVTLFNERLIAQNALNLLEKAEELQIPYPLKDRSTRALILNHPKFLQKLTRAPLIAKQTMIFIDNKKKAQPVFDQQLPPSSFINLNTLQHAFVKFDESSELQSLAPLSPTLSALELDLVQEAHNSNKVFNLDFKSLQNVTQFVIKQENILFPVTLNLSNLPQRLQELEIVQYKPPVVNGLQDELERLFKRTKGAFNLKKLSLNAAVSSQFLTALGFLKNIEVLKISCDESIQKVCKFQKLRELTIFKFQTQHIEFENLHKLKLLTVEQGQLELNQGVHKPITFQHYQVQGLQPYLQKDEITALRLSPLQTIEQDHLRPLQLHSDVITAVSLHNCSAYFDTHFTTMRESYPQLKNLDLQLRFSEEEYNLKLEDYKNLESLEIKNTNDQESLWFFEIKNCRKLKKLNFDKVHSLSLNLDGSLEQLNLKVSRKLLIETDKPELRIKQANLGFFHARNLEFLRFVQRANIDFNFNMISPISCKLEALEELTFKNTHRAYSKILRDISAHAPNLRYLEVEFELKAAEKVLDLESNSLTEIVLINPVEGLELKIEGEADPVIDVIPQEKRSNVMVSKQESKEI